jgi:Fe-S cluster biosynthesis and repair protein YggX
MLDLIQLTSKQLSKQSLNEWATAMVTLIEDDELNALEAHAKAKAIKNALDIVLKSTEDLAVDAYLNYGTKVVEVFGAQATYKNGAVTPDYEQDLIWLHLKEQVKQREELLKLAFKSKDVEITDTTTGEVVPKVQPKYAKSSISIQFK